jgi:D-3-phosphoglycerate dehydrogenase / 2-oxoglutarate reductase
MKLKVLISAPYMHPVSERFRSLFMEQGIELCIPVVHERLEEDELIPLIGDIDGVICGDDRFTEKVLNAAPKLKVISKWGTGIDSIDQEACKRLGIAVRNTPNAFSEPVADSVLGYLLCFARKLPWMDQAMHNGVWEKIPGVALSECTLGVIGVGNIGTSVVKRALGFGMHILGNDIKHMPQDFLKQTGIAMVSKEELLRQSDFVSLNCDLNPTSYHVMDEASFALMKPTAVVINLARGPIIKESALVHALQEKRIAGAALDVYEIEPLPPESPLCRMHNVLLAPHNSNSSPEAWEKVHQNSISNLLDVLGRRKK